jgi:hypothetical protein
LSGTAPQDQFNTLLSFDDALGKKVVNGQAVFDLKKAEHVSPRIGPNNTASWSLSEELLHSEAEEK